MWIDREASVQFAGSRAITLRVTGVNTNTYDGWVWLTGYVIGANGEAVERREVFVKIDGLRPAEESKKMPGRKRA